MEWTRINKANTTVPTTGISSYRDYKPTLRLEASKKCVYCAVHENPLGGSDHFHVEHYKPKSIPRFSGLIRNYNNLFYACAICNRFKSNDWPNDPLADHSISAYPDPNNVDYNTLFAEQDDGRIEGVFVASKYMVNKIFLNRPQLINERREYRIRKRFEDLTTKLNAQLELLKTISGEEEAILFTGELALKLLHYSALLNAEGDISRYEPDEIKR